MSTITVKFIANKSTVTHAKRVAAARHMNEVIRNRRQEAEREQARLDDELSRMLKQAEESREKTIADFYRMGRTGERSEMRNEVVSRFNRIH